MTRMCLQTIGVGVCVILLAPLCVTASEAAPTGTSLSFHAGADGSVSFDTGVLAGRLHAGGRSLGLTEVVYKPTGASLDNKDLGLLGFYRVFSGARRFRPDARDFPSTVRVLEDGAAEVTWKAAEGRPFELKAAYRLVAPATVDLEASVTGQGNLASFEVFEASYCSPAFSSCQIYCRGQGAATEPGSFLTLDKSIGDWLMAPRGQADVAMIQDGRWKAEPNPVDWKILPEFALPMGLRRDPASGLTLLFMARQGDAFALSGPQEKDSHDSLYFSLFGSGLAKGEVRRAAIRLVVAPAVAESQAVAAYQAFAGAEGPGSRGPVRRVLLVTGQDYPGHPWRQTAPALRSILEEDHRMVVTLTEDPAMLDSTALDGYDAVVLHFMNWQQPSPGAAAREKLKQRVSGGMGLVLVHFACGAWQDWPEFRALAGRVWDPKLTHDPHGLFRVDIVDPSHPITLGMPPFETQDELYSCLTGDRPIHLLACAKSKVDGRDYPMAFVLDYGKGRVFHTVLGHDLAAITNPSVANLIRRGCAWAAGLDLPPN
jgi:type 1 glutamine amidotransferase